MLQAAALRRALRAHRAGEGDGADKQDASFNRNARLAATLARLRLSLSRAKDEDGSGEAGAEDGTAEVTVYRIPDNGR